MWTEIRARWATMWVRTAVLVRVLAMVVDRAEVEADWTVEACTVAAGMMPSRLMMSEATKAMTTSRTT